MAAFLYEFEWDPVKASTNRDKHGLDFERAQPSSWTRSRLPSPMMSTAKLRSDGLRWERMRVANTRS
jgi:uncharacterized DUF497 family protein